ncbi:MAG: phospholipid scramblase-related protein [Pirellulales bacterium]
MLDRRSYAVKEHVGAFKITDRYDIYDAATGEQLGVAVEHVGWLMQILRIFGNLKQSLPTTIVISESEDGPPLLTIHRGFTFIRSSVEVRDAQGNLLGTLRSKLLTIGGGFYVYDAAGNQAAEVKGNWAGFNFRFLDSGGAELGTVSKQWGGMFKEMFTSADSYHIELSPAVPQQGALAALLLAAGLAIDMVYKEHDN